MEPSKKDAGSRKDSGKGSGRARVELKKEELGDDDGVERGRWPRRPRDSSPDVSNISKGRRNESPEELRRVGARRDKELDREAHREEDGGGRRGKVQKEREYSSDDGDRSTRRRVGNDRLISSCKSRGNAVEAPAGAFVDAHNLSLGVRSRKDKKSRLNTAAEIAVEGAPEVDSEIRRPNLSMFVEKGKIKPVLQINVEGELRRIASPSPKTKPHLPSASESESGGSDSSRSPSSVMSLTPEWAAFTKPTTATPDIRRGERSRSPSPLSPRSRLPQPCTL